MSEANLPVCKEYVIVARGFVVPTDEMYLNCGVHVPSLYLNGIVDGENWMPGIVTTVVGVTFMTYGQK